MTISIKSFNKEELQSLIYHLELFGNIPVHEHTVKHFNYCTQTRARLEFILKGLMKRFNRK